MKKLVPGILALLMAFGCLTACTPTDPESTPSGSTPPASTPDSTPTPTHQHETDLADVVDYYLEMFSKKDYTTYKNFKVPNTFSFMGATEKYDIAWASNVGVVTIEEGADGSKEDTVKLNEVTEDTPFVLTATVTDPEGCHTATFTVEGVAQPKPPYVPQAITEKPSEDVAYKLYVYQSTKEKDCYFMGEMSGYYFKTSEDFADAVDLYVEYIANSDNFNIYFKDASDAKQYIGVKLSDDGKHDNIVYGTTPTSSFFWNPTLQTICTHLDVNKNGEAADYYLGNYSSNMTFSASMLSYAGGAGNNVGGLVVMVDKDSIVISGEKKVADVKADLSVSTDHTIDKTVDLKTSDSRYDDVTITWAVEGAGATIADNKLNLVIPAEKATVTLTATITCGTASDTKEFTLELGPKTVEPAKTDADAIIAAAYNLASGETLPGGNYTLTGEITKVNTPWDAGYSNITVTITIGDKTFECYRLKSGDAADASVLKVGDTITVTGAIKNYNGKVEFDQGCVLDAVVEGTQGGGEGTTSPIDPEQQEIVDQLYALESGAKIENATLTGVVVEIKEAYSSYGNSTFIIVVAGREDKPVTCYRIKSSAEAAPQIGDVVTLTGNLTNYNGTREFENSATFVAITDYTMTDAQKLLLAYNGLAIASTSFDANVSVTLPTTTVEGVTINWTADKGTIAEGVFTYTATETTTIKLTATLTAGETNMTKEFTLSATIVVAGSTLPTNLTFTGAANKASADDYMKTNYADWTITGKLGQTYGGYLGFGRSGDASSAITSGKISVTSEFTVSVVLKGNGSSGVATSTLTFTLVDEAGNVVATGYAGGVSAICPADGKDTTYSISFTFVEGKTWTDVSNLKISFAKSTGNIGLKSLEFVQA